MRSPKPTQAEIERAIASAPTLLDQALRNPARAKRINARVAELRSEYAIEHQIERAMEERHVTRMELAARLGIDRSSVSRDLNRGLENASLLRVKKMLRALDYDLLPVLIPIHDRVRTVEEAVRVLDLLNVSIDDISRAAKATHKRNRKVTA
jgi:predicted XRE-type DNA-binding protein